MNYSNRRKLMAGIGKCMAIMTTAGLVIGGGSSYLLQRKANNVIATQAAATAKNGVIRIGGRTKDGKMWDGAISVEDFKKDLNKKSLITSGIVGLVAAIGTAALSGLTLLVKAKL